LRVGRENRKRRSPYSSARHGFTGEASIFLDANENAYGSPLPENFNRYPDPLQWKLKEGLSSIKNMPVENIFIGNGSDEVIDLVYRIFCEPGKDNVIICPPTYGMYRVSADINDVEVIEVPLADNFQPDVQHILQKTTRETKLLFLCSPNNPTGNIMNRQLVEELLKKFTGIIIIDEAYIDFARGSSFLPELFRYPNLIVMQTLSKAWGLASLRLGIAFASKQIIELFNKVKPPYNINEASQELALTAIENGSIVNRRVEELIQQRTFVADQLSRFSFVKKIFDSDANFLLVRVDVADKLYQYLKENKIIVRNRSRELNCEQCLRITIGTSEENENLLAVLNKYK